MAIEIPPEDQVEFEVLLGEQPTVAALPWLADDLRTGDGEVIDCWAAHVPTVEVGLTEFDALRFDVERWRPGKPLTLFLAGYVGAPRESTVGT